MKSVDLAAAKPTLAEVLKLAESENVMLQAPDGREFIVAEVDDLAREVVLVRNQDDLMQLLADRSKGTRRHTLKEARERLRG